MKTARTPRKPPLGLALTICLLAQNPHAETIFVNVAATGARDGTSWQDAFVDIHDALARARVADEVWVAKGTYHPDGGTLDPDLSYVLPDGVVLLGGFSGIERSASERDPIANVTTLSGDLAEDDGDPFLTQYANYGENSHHVLRATGVSTPLVIDGFSIGHALASAIDESGLWRGGGLVCDASSIVIRNCSFSATYADEGGAIFATNSLISLEGCTFQKNGGWAGTACLVRDSSITIMASAFRENQGNVYCVGEASESRVEDSLWEYNDPFSQCVVVNQSTATYSRCRFMSNLNCVMENDPIPWATSLRDYPQILDCLFVGNTGTHGGAIWNRASHPTILRTTIAGNATSNADQASGVESQDGSIPVLQSCILWANVNGAGGGLSAQLGTAFGGAHDISFSCVDGCDGALAASGNTGADPEFTDDIGVDRIPWTGDEELELKAGSSCIDSGDPTDLSLAVDLQGVPRILDGNLDGGARSDMGCFEFDNVKLSADIRLDVNGAKHLSLGVEGSAGLFGLLLVGREPGMASAPPFGALLFDPSAGWARFALGRLPVTVDVELPVSGIGSITLQALGVKPGAGNLSNAVSLDEGP